MYGIPMTGGCQRLEINLFCRGDKSSKEVGGAMFSQIEFMGDAVSC